MSASLGWADIVLRLALSILAGGLIGLDRGEHAHPVGLRTTILIAVAATVAMLEANWLVAHMADTHVSIVHLDMMRLPLGILSGVGFIGAGAILRRGEVVHGITTAATIWLVTVIGLCFGGGQIGLGVAATVIALATLWGLKLVEASMMTGRRGRLAVTFTTEGAHAQALNTILAARGFALRSRQIEMTRDGGMRVTCSGRYRGEFPGWSSALLGELATYPDVSQVEWRDID